MSVNGEVEVRLVEMGMVEETTPGTTPSAALQKLWVSKIDLKDAGRKKEPPKVIHPRRMKSNIVDGGGAVVLPSPLMYKNLLLPQEGLFGNDIETAVTVTGTTISFAAGPPCRIADSGNGLAGFVVGRPVHIEGGVNAGWVGPVIAKAAGYLELPDGQLTAANAGASITLHQESLVEGNLLKTYSHEVMIADDNFRKATRLQFTKGMMKWAQGAYLEESYEGAGNPPSWVDSTIGTGSPTAKPQRKFMRQWAGVSRIFIDGVRATGVDVASLEVLFERKNDTRKGLTSLGPSRTSVGVLEPSVKANICFDDDGFNYILAVDNNTTHSIMWDASDEDGNSICLFIPAGVWDGEPDFGEAEKLSSVDLNLIGHGPADDLDGPFYNICDFSACIGFRPAP